MIRKSRIGVKKRVPIVYVDSAPFLRRGLNGIKKSLGR